MNYKRKLKKTKKRMNVKHDMCYDKVSEKSQPKISPCDMSPEQIFDFLANEEKTNLFRKIVIFFKNLKISMRLNRTLKKNSGDVYRRLMASKDGKLGGDMRSISRSNEKKG